MSDNLAELRARTLRAHAWGGPGSVPLSPAEALSLIDVAEAAATLVKDWDIDPNHPAYELARRLAAVPLPAEKESE